MEPDVLRDIFTPDNGNIQPDNLDYHRITRLLASGKWVFVTFNSENNSVELQCNDEIFQLRECNIIMTNHSGSTLKIRLRLPVLNDEILEWRDIWIQNPIIVTQFKSSKV